MFNLSMTFQETLEAEEAGDHTMPGYIVNVSLPSILNPTFMSRILEKY